MELQHPVIILQIEKKSLPFYKFGDAIYLKKIETKSGCTKQFSLDTLQKICKALEINPKILFEELDDKKNSYH